MLNNLLELNPQSMANLGNKSKRFNTTTLLLCEGIEDRSFLRALIGGRNLGPFDVKTASDICGDAGKGAFSKALEYAVPITGFGNIERIGIIADADNHYRKTFNDICDQIKKANENSNVAGRFSIPAAPYQLSGGKPRIMIVLFPAQNRRGALDTLLWGAIQDMKIFAGKLHCIEESVDCADIRKWQKATLDKSRVRIALALSHKRSPAVSIRKIWLQYPDVIPIASEEFDEIAKAISLIRS